MDYYDNNGNVIQHGGNAADAAETEAAAQPRELTMTWVMQQIETITNDKSFLIETIKALQLLETHAPSVSGGEDKANAAKAIALGDLVKSREATNQQTLLFLEKMYDDLKPRKESSEPSFRDMKFNRLIDEMKQMPWDEMPEEVSQAIADVIRKSAGNDD